MTLQASSLVKVYGRTTALAAASRVVEPGEVVAVVGPSGSGKSTLLHCLSGLERPDRGTVSYAGQDLAALREPELTRFRHRHFGYVFQTASLVPELTALHNAALPAWIDGVPRRVALRRAGRLLDDLGLKDRRSHLPGQLSGGEAQRTAIARALAGDPAVVFADEPTGALDSRNAAAVADLLVAMAKEKGCAVVLVTHDEHVAGVADRQVDVRDGRTHPGRGA